MEIIKEFYENNREWIDRLLTGLLSAFVGWLTALFATRRSKLENLIDGKVVYDENDEIFIPLDAKPGTLVPLGQCNIVRKGKNADVKRFKVSRKTARRFANKHRKVRTANFAVVGRGGTDL